MKDNKSYSVLLLLFFTLLFYTSSSYSKTCVLSFFEKTSKEAITMDGVFEFYNEADYFKQAQIKDIKKCFTSGEYDEVLWVSHGTSIHNGFSSYSGPVLVKEDGSKLVLPIRFFEEIIKNTTYSTIKKVRINLCGLDFSMKDNRLHSTIDLLIKELSANQVIIEISPRFELGLNLLHEDVTTLDKNWLSKSIYTGN